MTTARWVGMLALATSLFSCTPALAQSANSVAAPAGFAPMQAPCIRQSNGSCLPVGADEPMPVVAQKAASVPSGGSVATAGTYQMILAANLTRKGCLVQNTSAATLKIFLGTTASATDAASLQVPAGGSFSCAAPGGLVVTDQISITASVSSATFVVVSQ